MLNYKNSDLTALYHRIPSFNDLDRKAFENIVVKGEYAGYLTWLNMEVQIKRFRLVQIEVSCIQ